jgi:pyruvate-formate lyase
MYMYPFYKRDKEAGKITEEDAINLVGWLFLKIQSISQFAAGWTFKANSGQIAMHISIGGQTADGQDATNDIDFIVLEVQKRLRLSQPSLTLLWHDKLSRELLHKSVDLIKTGIGQPQFLNNNMAIARLPQTFPGLSMEEARGAANVGCIPMRPSHSSCNLWGAQINMGKMVELVLNNGRDRGSRSQVGLKTGDTESLDTFERFQEAVDRQIAYVVDRALNGNNISFGIIAEMMPLPYQSCFIDDCIQTGKDLQSGGARYSTNWCNPIGTVDLGNSLAAIKKLVYEERRFTLKELKQALRANFEGEEYRDIYALCCNAPKYGNNNEYVDSIVRHCYKVYAREHLKHTDVFGKVTHPEAFSVSLHNIMGSRTGALPSGKKAGMPHTDASVSAAPGSDRKGPTALVRSAISVMDNMEYGSNHLNMKFHPSVVSGENGARNLLALVKTYMEMGGNHIQFNCVSGDTLKDAQLHPENYKDLVVRVAGFSAYFIHLDKNLQDEIIKRTELSFA